MKFTLQPRLLKQNLPNCQPSSKTKVYFEFCFQGGQYQSLQNKQFVKFLLTLKTELLSYD